MENILKKYFSVIGLLLLISFFIISLPGCSGSDSGGGSVVEDDSGDDSGDGATPTFGSIGVSDGFDPKTVVFSWEIDPEESVDHYRLEVDPDGASGFSAVDGATDIGTTEYVLIVPLYSTDWENVLYRVVALDGDDDVLATSDSVGLSGNITASDLIGYIKASNTEGLDEFGYSVALSDDGSTLAVGAWKEDSSAAGIDGDQNDNSTAVSGAVYVFTVDDDGVWSQQAYIKASNPGSGDVFGTSLSLSENGNTLAVGAEGEMSNATGIDGDQNNDDEHQAGAVYVFTRDGAAVWSQQAYIKASNTEADDIFGASVALSGDGDTLAVGASWEDSAATGTNGDQSSNVATYSGAVYVYTRDSTEEWSQQSYVKASNTDGGDYFGFSTALSWDGDTLAVGAFEEDSAATGIGGDQSDDSALESGAAYVFVRDNEGSWSQQAYIKASNTEYKDQFGFSLDLSEDGDTLAVGAIQEESSATGVNGDQSDNSADNSGAAYVFTRDSLGTWSQQAYIKASNTGLSDYFGNCLALSAEGNTLAVGAYKEDSDATGIGGDQESYEANGSGAAYVFTRDDAGNWSQQAYIKASNTDSLDHFGWDLALSTDGGVMAAGAYYENSAATGIDGDYEDNSATGAGAVYLY